MRKFAKFLCIAMALCLVFCLSACNDKEEGGNDVSTSTATIYYLSGCRYDQEVYTLDQLEIGDPAQCYIYFATDGTGILCIDGWETYFEYADGQLWEEIDPDTKCNYTVSGDSLTLEQDGYVLVFTQGELPEWAQPQEDYQETVEEEIYIDPESSVTVEENAEAPAN